jgi:hypothetical protein
MLKETKEFVSLLSSGIAATYKSLSDGKLTLTDIGNYINVFLRGEQGIQGVSEITSELADATPDGKQGVVDDVTDELLGDVPVDDAADIAALIGGIQGAVSMAARKTKKSTLTKVAAALNNGPIAASGDGWTAEQLAELID